MSANPVPVGRLITDPNVGRDAIHVPIAPCVAYATLLPGQHVDKDGRLCDPDWDKPVGIVDPFLRNPVKAGERFYIFLYPNTVTSLRHEWEHPAFPKATPPEVNEAVMNYLKSKIARME